MIDPGSIARGGYLETVLAIAVDGYLGAAEVGIEFVGNFIVDFTENYTGNYVSDLTKDD